MRRCHFIFALISTATGYAVARTELSSDWPLDDLFNTNGPAWNTDVSLFDQADNTDPINENALFNFNEDSDPSLFADSFNVCMDGTQPLSRVRARSGSCVNQMNPNIPSAGTSGVSTPDALETLEEVKDYYCPTTLYPGILRIPVCSEYDDYLVTPSDAMNENIELQTASGLKNLGEATLITPESLILYGCFKHRSYCCQAWLPKRRDLASRTGIGFWCARAFDATFVNPVDLLNPGS